MAKSAGYQADEIDLAALERLRGPAVLEFGNDWCGHCRRAQPYIAEAFAAHPDLPHYKVADASGRRLGRAFSVKLWPTLVFLRDGKELARVVRPADVAELSAALARIDPPAA